MRVRSGFSRIRRVTIFTSVQDVLGIHVFECITDELLCSDYLWLVRCVLIILIWVLSWRNRSFHAFPDVTYVNSLVNGSPVSKSIEVNLV